MAEFALGSLVTMVEFNPHIRILGHVPYLGSRLKFYWHWAPFGVLLVFILLAHLALLLITLWLIRSVVVANDSFVVITKLLNDTMWHAQVEGQATRETACNSDSVVYGPLSMPDGNYILRIGENAKSLKQWDRGRHPDKNYVKLGEKKGFLSRMGLWLAGRR